MDLKSEFEDIKKEININKIGRDVDLIQSSQKIAQSTQIENITKATDFSNAIDSAKIETIKRASAEDDKFNEDFKTELKQAVLKSAQLEKEKQELEKKNIELQQNFIKTKSELETQKQSVNKWENKQKAREYHYNGLKDIMLFVHINNPMCIPLMYIFAILVSPIYLVWTLILAPLGTLIAGTKDQERPKLVKGAIYTILCIALVCVLALAIYACMHYLFKWF